MQSATQFTEQAKKSALNSHKRITAHTVRQMCGDVSDMTLHRWLRDPSKQFPRPIYIGKRRYWRETDVVAWLEAQADTAA